MLSCVRQPYFAVAACLQSLSYLTVVACLCRFKLVCILSRQVCLFVQHHLCHTSVYDAFFASVSLLAVVVRLHCVSSVCLFVHSYLCHTRVYDAFLHHQPILP